MRMDFQTEHPLQALWRLTAIPLQSQALAQALAHQLFAHLAQPASASTVAERLGLHPGACAIWLELLWSMDLLSRQQASDAADGSAGEALFCSSALAQRYFLEAAPDYCGQAWQYRQQALSGLAAQWPQWLAQGQVAMTAPPGSWAQAARVQIAQEQRAITVPAIQHLLAQLGPLPATGRLLDLGGGPGHIGIALAQQLPQWQGMVCDEPATAAVAAENIAQAGLAARMGAQGCDVQQQDYGQGYDLIWCSSVLHFLPDPAQAVRGMWEALNAGGLLLLAHAERPDDPAMAACVLPFYAGLVLRGHYLPRPGDMARHMAAGGFGQIRALGRLDFPMAPVWLHAGRKSA
ncbi:class I SAM-dependent methyltransferase [Comamonas sp. JUb58]|uniref:class I SAM-dependent methyltransferase n=1 Tax=Comamonas sp. JUb58 TaxID=2485114 RepID=UPI00105E5D82|nr:class I SAM-dependent methyltransferase [Comamonas sp. JUb58]TDS83540.1 methyltransferase family protein [Comamonas sp. JUb58]